MNLWRVLMVAVAAGCVCGEAQTRDTREVGVGAAECQVQDNELHCDYTDAEQTVRVATLKGSNQNISRVVLANARHVEVAAAACINLSLQSVTMAEVASEGSSHVCKEGHQESNTPLEFSAFNSGLDRVPDWATRIHLDHSSVTSLALRTKIENLYVTSSDIKIVDLAQPLGNGSSATLVSSNIHNLQRLHTGPGSRLELRQTTIDVLASQGLVLIGGHVEIVASAAITVMDDGLVLGPLVNFYIRDFSGHLRIHVLESSTQERCENDIYFWLFIACVSVISVSLGILVLLKCNKRRKKSPYLGESRSYVFH